MICAPAPQASRQANTVTAEETHQRMRWHNARDVVGGSRSAFSYVRAIR